MHEQFRTCHGDQTLIGQFMYLEVRHACPHVYGRKRHIDIIWFLDMVCRVICRPASVINFAAPSPCYRNPSSSGC